ncbi:hypothetical protein HYZ82_00290 [Candidatus Nomurabacteria bacterium]|nr:hypothetical protein [Candidatus Nomurabacteria bacterium]
MLKRNFILLILVLSIALAVTLGFLYFREGKPTTPEDEGTGTNFFSQFNPFGGSGFTQPEPKPPTDVSGYIPSEDAIPTGKLRKISSMPVAGYGIFIKERLKEIEISPMETLAPAGSTLVKKSAPKTEFATAVRYAERAKGFIHQTFADKIEERKFSQTVIPKVYDAYFGNKAESVIMRYIKADERTIETFVGALPEENLGDTATNNEIRGYFLPNQVKDISVSPDGSKIFYLFLSGDSGDNMIGTILNLSNNSKTQIFDSPFTEWLSGWGSANTITLTTKPSGTTPGYAYMLDVARKSLTKALGGISGLSTLPSPNGKLILYSDGNPSLFIHRADTQASLALGIKTLPEKCVWGKVSDTIYCAVPKFIGFGSYPDSWYQGEASFDDQIWKIDVKTGNASIVLDIGKETGGQEIDSIKLGIDEGENYLFFVNKKDSFLWRLDLK